MSISIPGADYTPQLTGYTGQGAFRFWCQKVLPIVYDDSLSYYELLNKVVGYLNNVIADVASVEDNVGQLNESYGLLQAYVNEHMQAVVDVVNQYTEYIDNYFTNLDVQEEIDNKLDEMAIDGSLSTLIGPIVAATAPDVITQWLNEHITPTTPVIDNTLTISGAAADAKVTGDKIGELKTDLNDIGQIRPTSVNLFDGIFDESGYITSGEDTPSDNYKRTSKYYPIIGDNTGNFYSYVSVTSDVFSFVFYDENKTFLENRNTNNTQIKQNTLPDDAKYFRVYTRMAWAGDVTVALSYVNSYIPYTSKFFLYDKLVVETNLTQALQDKINNVQFVGVAAEDLLESQLINIFDGTFPNSGYIESDGSDASSASYKRTDYIPVDDSNNTLYVLRTAQPYILVCYFYDSSKNAVGSRTLIFNENASALATSLPIPTTSAYIRMYTHATNYNGNLMLSYTQRSVFVPYGDHYFLKDKIVSENNLDDDLKAKVNSVHKLTGKTIAFMGDSIIGNFYDATGVCAILAEKTGATVINCAFGGTRMGYEFSAYGDATPTATGYIDGATDAEKNQVDQYRYWNCISGAGLADAIANGTWALQDNAVANMSSGLAYFTERLAQMKAVDWSTVDFIMWEYGTNDFSTRVALEGNDLFAYDYAYRHAIETILTAYPNIRLITATPIYRWYQSNGTYTEDSNTRTENDYNGTPRKLTDFVSVAQDVSKGYQIPCIDDYYTMGANRFTRLAFFNSTDGTHPNAQGRKRIGEHLAAQLVALI